MAHCSIHVILTNRENPEHGGDSHMTDPSLDTADINQYTAAASDNRLANVRYFITNLVCLAPLLLDEDVTLDPDKAFASLRPLTLENVQSECITGLQRNKMWQHVLTSEQHNGCHRVLHSVHCAGITRLDIFHDIFQYLQHNRLIDFH